MVGLNNAMDPIDVLAIPDFGTQMEGFRQSDEARQGLLHDILQKYAILMQEYTNMRNDYVSEKDIRRNYQNEIARTQSQLHDMQLQVESNSFVLALIDGDGAIFKDALLANGANGGSEAASILSQAIRNHLAQIYVNASWPIMAHIYLSLDKLAMILTRAGVLKHPQELRQFAQSFSVNQPLFSIIDVGQGKERADYRIKEMLRTFSDNPTCRHIIFGGCHDQGYLLNLDQYKHSEKASRITLMETTPAAKGFAELPNFKKTRFGDVFRQIPLTVDNAYSPLQMQAQPAPPPQPLPQPIAPPTRTLSKPSPVASPAPPEPAPVTASPATTSSSLAGQVSDSGGNSWSTVSKTGVQNNNISIALNKNNPKKKYIYYNKNNQRLDEPLPNRDRNALDAIEQRMAKAGRNLCNNWHLSGTCHNGDFCRFLHAPKLTAAELIALKYKTRSLACKRKDCENFGCYLGHQCSFERDQGYCPFPDTCNLRTSHGMDKTKYVRWDEDGNEEFSK
ncbi:hypothetical protein EJ04DRAFT_249625 [Polyplosphaeria fusca]|uniref:C3H1-type domain-containing protein n=1 Tax=Polyplosphaeria fusca TaxID=682080 RepID=A0A9P4QUL4_9PLEO|nr:hypothetical protein EJ04DRAFT_249625 [Polyplosphaeria fusca]